MKVMNKIKDERGFALVLALVVMSAMTAIGIAAVTSSTTDLMIAKNEKEAKMAFYLAEAGIEEAIARLSLPDTDTDWYKGEIYTVDNDSTPGYQDYRILNPTTAVLGKSFSSHGLHSLDSIGDLSALGGTYDVTMEYAYEDDSGDAWCRGAACDVTNEVVIYCYDFIGGNTPADCPTGFPVYEISSTGTTNGGTSARIISYVSAAALNLLPPGDTILFTEGEIDIGASMNGKVASWSDYLDNVEVDGCVAPDCEDVSDTGPDTWIPPYGYIAGAADNEGIMVDYLGMSINTLKGYADINDFHPNENNSQMTIRATDYVGGFGTMCFDDDTETGAPDYANHICDNRPKIIVIDNYDEAGSASWGPVVMAAGERGRGLLIITGDLRIAGNFRWEGMVFVMGDLSIAGTATVYGTIMVEGDGATETGPVNKDVDIGGALSVFGSRPVASSVAIGMSVPKMLRWTRL